MFDVGFSEIVVIAVVALVVIGPERLPTVARTIGALLGRLNRYVADVKSDVEREMRLDEMKKLRAEVEQQAMSIEQSVVQELETARVAVEQPVAEAVQSLAEVVQETGQAGAEIQQASVAALAFVETSAAADNLQKNTTDAAPASREAKVSPTPQSTPQATLDFDSTNPPLATPTASTSGAQPAAKA